MENHQELKEQPPPPPPTTPADPPAAADAGSSSLEFVPPSSGTPVKRGGGKKPRPFTSCISCRRRKIRCLNENIPCKPCLEYGEVCSLLATEEAQNYQPPPPEVLKDQGIKVKRRRKTSTTRRQSIKKAKLAAGEGGEEAGPSSTAGPSTKPPPKAPKAARTNSDPSTSISRPEPARSLSVPSVPYPSHSVSPSVPGSSDFGAEGGRHLTTLPRQTAFAQPALPQAAILPPTLAPQQRTSPLVSNSLGSLSIRRDSTSPASTPLSHKRPHDWDFMPPLHNHLGAITSASPSFQLPSPSFFGASPNYALPSPASSHLPPPLPSARLPIHQQHQPAQQHLLHPRPQAAAKSPIKLDFLLTPWSPTNDTIGPGSIRPRPLEPLPPTTDRPADGGGLARPPELEPVIEESPENSQLTFSPQVVRPTSAMMGATAKSEPHSTPVTIIGSLRHPTPSPALALSAGGGQTPGGGIPGYSASLGSFTSPYEGRSPLPQELLETLVEPVREERAAFQSAFKTALGWLFPWCDPARFGKASRGGQWALWSLGVRLTETEDKTKKDRARFYLARAKELAGVQAISSEPTMDHLETVILIAWADYGLAESARATRNWCGVALTIAEGLGAYDPDPGIIPRLVTVLQSLYQLDKILSIRLHRPPAFSLASPLSKFIPRQLGCPTSAFEAITTLCGFLGQIAYWEYQVRQDPAAEREARSQSDQVLQSLERWLTDLKGKNGYLTRKDEAESRGRVWVELWLQGVFILLNSPRLLLPQALPLDTHVDVARSSAEAVTTLIQTYSSLSPSVLISPYLDVPVHFALSTIECDIEGMASPAQGLAGLGQGIMKDQRLEESRALRDWLKDAGSVWGF